MDTQRKQNEMNANEITQKLSQMSSNDEEYDTMIQALHDEVEPLTKTATDGNGGIDTTLYDWLFDGKYDGTETAEGLAEDWNELEE